MAFFGLKAGVQIARTYQADYLFTIVTVIGVTVFTITLLNVVLYCCDN